MNIKESKKDLTLIKAFEQGKLKRTKNFKKEMKQAKQAAKNYFKKGRHA